MSEPLIGLGALAKAVFRGEDLTPLREHLLERTARDRHDANALMDLSTAMQLLGHPECGLRLQASALQIQQVFKLGQPMKAGVRLLSLACPGDLSQNNALEFLVEGSGIALETLYVAPGLPLPAQFPEHDVAMVVICESDRNRPLLEHVDRLTRSWPRPLICKPRRIAGLSRNGASELLKNIGGAETPMTRRITRMTMARLNQFPVIARPIDSHKGEALARLDNSKAVSQYLEGTSEDEFYVSPYVDFRSADGQFRKYRIVLIDGRPYICHLAISSNWIVHYLSSGMVEDRDKRAEEAQLFETFDREFAFRHRAALQEIVERVDLEYFGIDCAESPEGELLIFEVDSGMTVHAMDPVDIFPYKQPQMRKVFSAFRRMLEKAARVDNHQYRSSSVGI